MEKDEYKPKHNDMIYKGVTIKDNDEKQKKRKYIKKVLTNGGQFMFEIDGDKKCHCCSGKKYKNCCKHEDIIGDYDKDKDEFFCEMEKFVMFFSMQQPEEKNGKKRQKRERRRRKNTRNNNNCYHNREKNGNYLYMIQL